MAEHPILPHPEPGSQVPTASERRTAGRFEAAWGVALAIAFLALALVALDRPDGVVFDEIHHAQPAMELAAGRRPEGDWTHPPLVKDAIAASMRATGAPIDPDRYKLIFGAPQHLPPALVWAWRLPSALVGALAVFLLFLLARAMSGSAAAGAAAAGLLALDGCFFVHARTAMTNVYEVAFVVAAALGAWQARATGRDRWLALAGLALGATMACRWSGAAPALLLGGWLAWHLRAEPWRLARLVAAWAVLPALVYAAAYMPMVHVHGGLGSLHAWKDGFFDMQYAMYNFHAHNTYTHKFASPWWSWPLMLRPVWYDTWTHPPLVNTVWAIGNAVVWWASVPALLLAARAGWKGHAAAGLVALLGLGTWGFWAVQPRALTFMHYYLPVIPFACVAMALAGQAWWHGRGLAGGPPPLDRQAARVAVAGVLVLAGAWFAFYYPALTAATMTQADLERRVWFGPAWR